jgi:hypothetical protein
MIDNRKFERFEIQVPATIEIPAGNGQGTRFELETQNLSAGGALIKFVEPLPEGSQVKIDIVLSFEELKTDTDPNGSLILSTTGHIIRSSNAGIAIRFDENYEFKTNLNALYHKEVPLPER